jgi:hypothetical protein
MNIHHFTLPARDPERVARVLAELTGGTIAAMPHPHGAWIVADPDEPSTLLEVWPANARAEVGNSRVVQTDDPAPPRWPHHAYVSVPASIDSIKSVLDREGWTYEVAWNGAPNGPGFELVRAWIEDHAVIEFASPEQLAQYREFCRGFMAHAAAAAG